MPAHPNQIRRFLEAFKRAAQSELYVINREKNLRFLTEHGMSVKERKELLLGLRVCDYEGGPEVDDRSPDEPPSVWVFGVEREGIQIT